MHDILYHIASQYRVGNLKLKKGRHIHVDLGNFFEIKVNSVR